jgi:hypothetical protein
VINRAPCCGDFFRDNGDFLARVCFLEAFVGERLDSGVVGWDMQDVGMDGSGEICLGEEVICSSLGEFEETLIGELDFSALNGNFLLSRSEDDVPDVLGVSLDNSFNGPEDG